MKRFLRQHPQKHNIIYFIHFFQKIKLHLQFFFSRMKKRTAENYPEFHISLQIILENHKTYL